MDHMLIMSKICGKSGQPAIKPGHKDKENLDDQYLRNDSTTIVITSGFSCFGVYVLLWG